MGDAPAVGLVETVYAAGSLRRAPLHRVKLHSDLGPDVSPYLPGRSTGIHPPTRLSQASRYGLRASSAERRSLHAEHDRVLFGSVKRDLREAVIKESLRPKKRKAGTNKGPGSHMNNRKALVSVDYQLRPPPPPPPP